MLPSLVSHLMNMLTEMVTVTLETLLSDLSWRNTKWDCHGHA